MSNEKSLTKKDLREELGKFTEEVLSPTFVTKDDFNEKINKMADIFATKEDLKQFVTKDEFNGTMNRVITTLDTIVKNFDDHKIEHTSNQAAHDRFEKRITKLEKCTITKIAGR